MASTIENRARTFFLGAGASRAAGYPLSSELIAGVADYVCAPKTFSELSKNDLLDADRLRDYLFSVYGTSEKQLKDAAECWTALASSGGPTWKQQRLLRQLPDLTEILSCIDIFTQEDLSVGPYRPECQYRFQPRRLIDARELRSLRRAFSRALAHGFHKLDLAFAASKPSLTDRFVSHLGPRDSVVTSNWDILVDRALHQAFGTGAGDYGTPISWLDPKGVKNGKKRPPLLKLHGSLNWLQCRRCQTLYADPTSNVALGEFDDAAPLGHCRECGFRLSTLMVTPSFLKDYKNSHLGAVWNSSLRALCRSSEWIFVGYSLPADDVHIKTMLIRAFRVWADRGLSPHILVVGHRREERTFSRYRQIFPSLHIAMYKEDFRAYVDKELRFPSKSNGLEQPVSGERAQDDMFGHERRKQILRAGLHLPSRSRMELN